MVHWLDVKKSRNKPSMEEIIKGLQAKKKMEDQNHQAAKEEKKRLRKERREQMRKEQKQQKQEAEAHLTSYINGDQFEYLHDSIKEINSKITNHSETIDEIEKKLLQINAMRKKRKQKNEMDLHHGVPNVSKL